MNQVERRIQELASLPRGQKRRFIRSVRRKVVIPNRRYSWMLFENTTDLDPVETVVMDVDLDQVLQIDRGVSESLRNIFRVAAWEKEHHAESSAK